MNNWVKLTCNLGGLEPSIAEILTSHWAEVCIGLEEQTGPEGKALIIGYLPATENGRNLREALFQHIRQVANRIEMQASSLTRRISEETVGDIDWSENWKEFYHPVYIAERFCVYPSWERPESGSERDIMICMDPDQAFGTGQHESTQLCLQLLERIDLADKKVADIGCGSGILSIAVAKLGSSTVFGCDTDALAVDIARRNILRNGVNNIVTLRKGSTESLESEAPFDLVMANILVHVLLDLSKPIQWLLHEDSLMIWSGITAEQRVSIEDHFRTASLKVCENITENEWCAYLLQPG